MASIENKQKILNELKAKKFLKIISGIQNYDKQKTLNVAMAAELGEASALDICDDLEIIKAVRASVQLPLFVSSIDPEKLFKAQEAGADVLEIGNYESFYKASKMFTPKEILEIVRAIKQKISANVLLCCTVPSTLELENQIKLSKELLMLGVDILQTEGFALEIPASDRKDKEYTDILNASSTLANTIALSKALKGSYIITASGINSTTLPFAFAAGGNGIGVGTYINSCTSQIQMTERVQELVELLGSKEQKIVKENFGKKAVAVK